MKRVTSLSGFVSRSSHKRSQFRWLAFFLMLLTATLVFVVGAMASTFILQFGVGELNTPRGIAVDTAGNVYVTDANGAGSQIRKYDGDGAFITTIGANNDNPDGFINAFRITTDTSGNVYATDGAPEKTSNLVKKFNSAGTFQFAFGGRGSGNGQFASPGPAGVAVKSSGEIYVADPGNNRIQKFSSTGTFISVIGSSGT
ncbi:MAG: SBBP repeat-containing protein, partial [Pyrinomonadaceae bacterium]